MYQILCQILCDNCNPSKKVTPFLKIWLEAQTPCRKGRCTLWVGQQKYKVDFFVLHCLGLQFDPKKVLEDL